MDSPPSAAHPFGARFARPKWAAPHFVNPLRGCEFPALPVKQKWAPFGDPSLFGGGGGNRGLPTGLYLSHFGDIRVDSYTHIYTHVGYAG